jgi:hypothetical protein
MPNWCSNVDMCQEHNINTHQRMKAIELTLPKHASHGDLFEYFEDGYPDDEDTFDDAHNAMYEDKVSQAKASGLYDDIKKNGVKEPVWVSFSGEKPEVVDGHKRVFSAFDVDMDMEVPVQDVSNSFKGRH